MTWRDFHWLLYQLTPDSATWTAYRAWVKDEFGAHNTSDSSWDAWMKRAMAAASAKETPDA